MNTTVKNEAIKRLNIVEGHLKKVKAMLEAGAYCPDVIHQSQAVQAALKKIDEIVLEGHLEGCVLSEMKSDKRQKLAREILEVFKKKS